MSAVVGPLGGGHALRTVLVIEQVPVLGSDVTVSVAGLQLPSGKTIIPMDPVIPTDPLRPSSSLGGLLIAALGPQEWVACQLGSRQGQRQVHRAPGSGHAQ